MGKLLRTLPDEFSVDPNSQASGGSLGNMDLANFPPQMTAALDAIAHGAFSTPIDMGRGFVILKAENRQKSVTPFEEVKDQIKEDALKETAQEVVKELREKAAVEFPAEVTAPAADTKVADHLPSKHQKRDTDLLKQNNLPTPSFGFWRIYVFNHYWIAAGLFE